MSVAPPPSFKDPFAPPSKPLPPPAPTPLTKKPAFWAVVGVVGLAVLGGSAAATVALAPRSTPSLPFDPAALPPSLGSVRKWRPSRITPPAAVASGMARFCGAVDVVQLAADIDEPFAKEILADAINAKEETQKGLRCAAALAKDLAKTPRYALMLRDDKRTRMVSIFPTTLAAWPDAGKVLHYSEGPKTLASIACFSETGEGRCADEQLAIAKIPGTTLWLSGSLSDLDVVARAYQDRHATERSKALLELAPKFDAFPSSEVGTADAEFFFRALWALDDFQSDVRKANDAFRASLERSDAVFGFGEGDGADPSDDVLEIVADTEDDAKDVESTLKDLRLALKHAKPRDTPDDLTRAEAKAYEAYNGMYRRALDEAEVERDKNRVRLVLKVKPDPTEKAAFDERDKDYLSRAKHGTALYEALLAGKEPSDELLQAIGGDLPRAVKDRKDGPPTFPESGSFVDVPSVPGLSLPPGTTTSGTSTYFTYEGAKSDLPDRIAAHLRKTGWSVLASPGTGGPSFECTKDGTAVLILVFARKHSFDVDVITR
jgi:hypothetical protein